MTKAERDEGTIAALKIALEQAADLLSRFSAQVQTGPRDLPDEEETEVIVARLRTMAAPEWEALPVEPDPVADAERAVIAAAEEMRDDNPWGDEHDPLCAAVDALRAVRGGKEPG